MSFHRPCGHTLAHASKDGKTTLCGIWISDIWAAVDENLFREERPCPECLNKLTRVFRKGRQMTFAEEKAA